MSDYVIMAKEPLESVVPNDVRQWLKEDFSKQHLADAFADVSNKTSWLMHDADEDWTVLEILDGWHKLYDELYAKILEILSSENLIGNPNIGTHFIVKPFMEQYGYRDGGGWWIIRICNVEKGWKTGSCCESHFGDCPNLYISFGGFEELKEIDPPKDFKWDKYEVTVIFTNKEKQEDKFNEVKAEKLKLLRKWVENLPIKQ